MDKYVCTVCGYVYDPAQGDPDSGVAPGTSFDDIPDDWVCPICDTIFLGDWVGAKQHAKQCVVRQPCATLHKAQQQG